MTRHLRLCVSRLANKGRSVAQILPVIGVFAAVLSAGAAVYGTQQLDKLETLRADVGSNGAQVETFVATLRGQEAGVDERMQALRAVAATPEMPVSGAQLQAQIDRLLTLRAQASALAADDPAAVAIAASRAVVADVTLARDEIRAGGKGLLDDGRALVGRVDAVVQATGAETAPQAMLEILAD